MHEAPKCRLGPRIERKNFRYTTHEAWFISALEQHAHHPIHHPTTYHTPVSQWNYIQCHARLGAVVLYHVLVVNSVFFILGIKSVRSLGCLLYSLYFLREDLVH